MTGGTLCFGVVLLMYCPDTAPPPTREFCKVYEQIRVHPSRKDTLETRRMIAVQEETYDKVCLRRGGDK